MGIKTRLATGVYLVEMEGVEYVVYSYTYRHTGRLINSYGKTTSRMQTEWRVRRYTKDMRIGNGVLLGGTSISAISPSRTIRQAINKLFHYARSKK